MRRGQPLTTPITGRSSPPSSSNFPDRGSARQVGHVKSAVIKRTVNRRRRKTSVSLEGAFWNGLEEIAHSRKIRLSEMIAEIDAQRQHGILSSALRLFVLAYYRNRSAHLH